GALQPGGVLLAERFRPPGRARRASRRGYSGDCRPSLVRVHPCAGSRAELALAARGSRFTGCETPRVNHRHRDAESHDVFPESLSLRGQILCASQAAWTFTAAYSLSLELFALDFVVGHVDDHAVNIHPKPLPKRLKIACRRPGRLV